MTSSVIVALLAVGIVLGFAAVRTGGRTPSSSSGAIPTVSIPLVPSTTSPATGTTPPTVARPAPTTTAPPAPTTTAATVGTCRPADVVVATSSDSSSYPPGSTVTVTTTLRDVRECIFTPAPAGPYGCASTIVITDAAGGQVWPSPGQTEQCSSPSSGVLQPGDVQTLRAAWNQQESGPGGLTSQQAPAGQYQAVGTWAWSSGGGAPYQASARSTFSLS